MPLDEELVGDDISEMWKNAARWKVGDKWRSFGWNVLEIDGHRIEQISKAINLALQTKGTPSIIISRTIKGKSVEHMEDNPKWHGVAPSPQISPIIDVELDCQFLISPSIIAGDMANLENEVKRAAHAQADFIHLDVMDGIFVENKTFDHEKIKQLRPITPIPFDTHLMINEPVKHIQNYVDAGCDIITCTAAAAAAAAAAAKSFQSCPSLCDPMDGSPPGPAVPGVLQARTLEWVAMSSSNA